MMLTSMLFTFDKRGVQRRRLARSRRPGDQHHAVRIRHRLHQLLLGARLDAELLEVERQVPLVEDSEHDLLAEQRGQGRHAIVDDLVPHLELDAPVLRHASLGDVELRHDLEARDQRRLELERRLHHFLQRTVDAVAHAQLVLEALEVDVGGAALDRVREDRVDQLDDRRVVDLRRQRGRRDILFLLFHHLDVARLHELLEEGRHRRIAGIVVLLDHPAERDLARDDREDVVPRDELEILEDPEVRGIGHRHRQRAPFSLEREDEVLGRDVGGNELDDARIDLELRQVDGREPSGARDDLGELELLDRADLYEIVGDAEVVGLPLTNCAVDLLLA